MEFEFVARYGPSGLGDVRFNESETGQLVSVKIVSADGAVYPIAIENVSPRVIKKSMKQAYFSLSEDETQLQTVRPWDGLFPVRFSGFTRRGPENDLLEPYVKRGGERQRVHSSGKVSKYNVPDQLRFTSILKVWAGEGKDYEYIYWLPYVFEPGTNGGTKAKSRSSGSLDRLREFLKFVGWNAEGNEEIPYSDNILPFLEAKLLERAAEFPFMIKVEKGWPVSLEQIPTGLVWS